VGKTDDGRRSCSDSVYCAEEGGRKGSLMCSVCCIHGEPLGFGRIPKEVGSTKAVEYRTVSGRVVYYGRMLYRNDFEKSQKIFFLSSTSLLPLDPWLCAPQARALEMCGGVVKGGV
jgi:hypothetical protein